MSTNNQPLFISVEGLDGSGKTTICKLLSDYISEQNKLKTIVVEQNKKHTVGLEIRRLINTKATMSVSPNVMLHLFLAGIQETIEKDIVPAIKNSINVIADRYTLSTRVYQHDAFNVNEHCELIENNFIKPDFTFVLDVDPAISMKRVKARGEAQDIFEAQDLEVYQQRRKTLIKSVPENSSNIFFINANQPIEKVFKDMKWFIHRYIFPETTYEAIDTKNMSKEDVFNLLFKQ